jgi:glutaryl-CoA dehydrogenase
MARAVAADGRDMLGITGFCSTTRSSRDMVDLEAIHPFEGTETRQTLIVGRAITAIRTFASADLQQAA